MEILLGGNYPFGNYSVRNYTSENSHRTNDLCILLLNFILEDFTTLLIPFLILADFFGMDASVTYLLEYETICSSDFPNC